MGCNEPVCYWCSGLDGRTEGDDKGMANWDNRFRELVEHIGGWSKDSSTKVGCVIVGSSREIRSTGYNGLPRKVDDDQDYRHERPEKYFWYEHAERNAIYNAARVGTPLEGCTIYCSHFPCADCARAIVQSGITRVVTSNGWKDKKRWEKHSKVGLAMFEEAGVEVEYYDES